jgi:hypothetical protein
MAIVLQLHLMPLLMLAAVVAHLPLRVLQLLKIYAVILFLRAFSFWVMETTA